MFRLALPAAALAMVVGTAFAQSSDVPQAVTARQGIMQNYAFALGTLGGMARGNIEYDAELAQRAADRLVTISSVDMTDYWPEGTSSEELSGESRALPAIWDNMDDFMAGFGTLNEAAVAMAEVAGDSQEALGGQMQGIGGACGGCHEDYQMSND